jgi:hypothetical protein
VKKIFLLVIILLPVSCARYPNPKVESHSMIDASVLFDYRIKVQCLIKNYGGDGNVVLEVTVIQGNNKYEKLAKRFFKSDETANMEILFPEVEANNDPIHYEANAKADK